MAKEFTVALQREIQARAAVESEVTDLHRASGELREWALKELDRLRTYAQTQVNELVAECAKRRDEANAYKSRMEEHAESSKTLDRALTEPSLAGVNGACRRGASTPSRPTPRNSRVAGGCSRASGPGSPNGRWLAPLTRGRRRLRRLRRFARG